MFRLSRALRNATEGVKNRLLFTLASPSECILHKSAIDSVTAPGVEGVFTLTNGHSQMVSQLAPGVITIRSGATTTEYFISNGFAYFEGLDYFFLILFLVLLMLTETVLLRL